METTIAKNKMETTIAHQLNLTYTHLGSHLLFGGPRGGRCDEPIQQGGSSPQAQPVKECLLTFTVHCA